MGNAQARDITAKVSSTWSTSAPVSADVAEAPSSSSCCHNSPLAAVPSVESALSFEQRVSGVHEQEPLVLPPSRPPVPCCELRVPLVLELSVAADTGAVSVAGSFSDWQLRHMGVSERDASTAVFLDIVDVPLGCHQYRFLVDGQWQVDPRTAACLAPDSVPSEHQGALVNCRELSVADIAECQSLEQIAVCPPARARQPPPPSPPTPPGAYTNQLPPYQRSLHRPPALPPHLLQVLLNKDTPLSCEPTLLPAPNHVMLNHLYALSIRNGVMALSATHRYRKKYVTTLLYRPI